MIPLSSYIKNHIQFTVGGTVSDKLLIFDVDDTLIHTTANIHIVKNGETVKTISNKEFNTYTLNPGESFDFQEFNDAKKLSMEQFTKYWITLKREYNKGTHISILTARSNVAMIRNFFLKKGIDIKPSLVFAISDPKLNLTGNVQERKAKIIEMLAKLGYKTMVFFDDNKENLEEAKKIEKKLNIKIHTVHV